MKKWLKKTLAIMLIAILMPVTSSFAVEENMTDFTEVNSTTTEEEIVKITKEDGLSVIGCSSYSKETNDTQPPENAIDGNLWTIWHSDYINGTDETGYDRERYITFDLGKEYYLSKVVYYPRQDINLQSGTGYNGIFKDCNVYGKSNENDDWVLLKSETGWAKDNNKKEVIIDTSILVRYVKVEGASTYVNKHEEQWYINKFASAAEIEFYVDTTVETVIEKQPVGGNITAVGNGIIPFNLSVTAKEGSTYQWFENTEKSYQNAVEINNANKNMYMVPNETKYYFVKVTNGDKSVYSDIVMVEKADIAEGATIYEAMIARETGNYYGSFADAVNSAQNGETVKLLRNVELSQAISIKGKKITIDGHNGDDNFTINLKNPNNKISYFFSISCKSSEDEDTEVIFDGVTIDGGAVWSGDIDPTLQRGTTNIGQTLNSSYFMVNTSATLKIINGCILQNNASKGYYRIIYVSSPNRYKPLTKVYIENSIIRDNISDTQGTVIYAAGESYGYADTYVYINNSEIYGNQNNSSGDGSIIYLYRRCAVEISGGSIHNNDGGKSGGVVFDNGYDNSFVTVSDNAKIENNKAQYGGAFYLNGSGASLNLNDCTVRQNYADGDGGAIYVNNGTVTMENNALLEENRAKGVGGAIYLCKGTLNLNECEINKNSAQSCGGAINILNGNDNDSTVNLGNVKFSGNTNTEKGPYGDKRYAANAIYHFNGTQGIINITGQPIMTENDDIFLGWEQYPDRYEKMNIKVNYLNEKSITVTPLEPEKNHHAIAQIDTSVQDTVDRESIVKAFLFPKELNLDEKAVYIKENEIFYGDPVNCTKDIPQTMIEFTEEENPTYNFQLSVEATGTDITYKWYESDTVNGTYTLLENETKNTLNITGMGYGKKYYYCEIDNGELSSNGPYKSTICKVEVSEFYPCSQAVDKFERV